MYKGAEVTSHFFHKIRDASGAGHGEYWFIEYDRVTGDEISTGPLAINDSQNSSNGSEGEPGDSAWRTEFLHADHLGSTRLLADELGVVVGKYKYYPFGPEAEMAGGANVRMRYTGHERDSEIALDYMKARYCGPRLARFLSVDPADDTLLENPQSWNKYAYVRNSPIVANDPDGKVLNFIAAAKGAVVGAVVGGGIELGKQWWNGEGYDLRKVGASAAGGAATGAFAGMTMGGSLVAEIARGGTAATLGGVVERGTDGDTSTVPLNGSDMLVDVAGGGLGGAAASVVTSTVSTAFGSEFGRQVVKSNPVIKTVVEKVAPGLGKTVGKGAGRKAAEGVIQSDTEQVPESQQEDEEEGK